MNTVKSIVRTRAAAAALKTIDNSTELGNAMPQKMAEWVKAKAKFLGAKNVYLCNGSELENQQLLNMMQHEGMLKQLPKYDNCWLARTDPADVARVEGKTVIGTRNRHDTVPTAAPGTKGQLGNWVHTDDLDKRLNGLFSNCMAVPFSMGPIGGRLSKIGVELTDSPYVVASMRIMTRMGEAVSDEIMSGSSFVKCLHSVGQPLPYKILVQPKQNWPCNPENTVIAHFPERDEISSFGSGYGGNSLLGKKCLALRLGSIIARREGWLAEHMLIIGVTPPNGKKRYLAAAFPSACGKTNLAMMMPTLPGYKVECVGDDIAWMKFDADGRLRAINPEFGFFGVAPGTSRATNPRAMDTIQANTIFTNVAETDDGGVYWEGMEKELLEHVGVTDWQGKPWKRGSNEPAAHPNSRFCTPLEQLAVIDPQYNSADGVPIDAILFGGRRPEGVPLVYESFDWNHGVYYGATMRSEATAAAEFKGKVIMHDPFAMRPFFGYNFGHYLQHWLDMPVKYPNAKLPKMFMVNWFRKPSDGSGGFLWPGYGENSRVIDWIIRRIDDSTNDSATPTPIGYIPKKDKFRLDGMKENINWDELFSVPKQFWINEAETSQKYLTEQVGADLPQEMTHQYQQLLKRLNDAH